MESNVSVKDLEETVATMAMVVVKHEGVIAWNESRLELLEKQLARYRKKERNDLLLSIGLSLFLLSCCGHFYYKNKNKKIDMELVTKEPSPEDLIK